MVCISISGDVYFAGNVKLHVPRMRSVFPGNTAWLPDGDKIWFYQVQVRGLPGPLMPE